MNTITRKHRIAALLSVVGALLILGEAAQAATSKPAGMSNAEYRALMIRSQALNDRYGLGSLSKKPERMTVAEYRALVLRSEALNQKYGLGGQKAVRQGMTAAEFRALVLRSEALNQKYGLGKQMAAVVTTQPTNSTRGFAWGAFGIGAAVMFGLALAGGFFVLHRLLATRRGLTPYRTT